MSETAPYEDFVASSKKIMTKMGQFYLDIKEEYETATESIAGLDDELMVDLIHLEA